jgi:hypothetical protein
LADPPFEVIYRYRGQEEPDMFAIRLEPVPMVGNWTLEKDQVQSDENRLRKQEVIGLLAPLVYEIKAYDSLRISGQVWFCVQLTPPCTELMQSALPGFEREVETLL